MHGAIFIDKPDGITSADVIRKLKSVVRGRRLGHAGTLDPFATGLLIVLTGKATKLQDVIFRSGKVYQGIIRLGLKTDTDDITGKTLEEDLKWRIDEPERVAAELEQKFTGELMQTPPQVSAVHVDGVRSYKLARRGLAVPLTPRPVTVDELKLAFIDKDHLSYYMCCSAGTYVRSLARDIGEYLGTFGCVETLRRTAIGSFSIENAHSLELVTAADDVSPYWIPIEELVAELPRVELERENCRLLRHGNQDLLADLMLEQSVSSENYAAAFDSEGRFCALLERGQKPDPTVSESAWQLRFVL